jgi:pimeloyl-ACP methyl ester carboxylesterase
MLITAMVAPVALIASMTFLEPKPVAPERKTCKAADGVPIVYTAAGSGEPALVFIHGGFANRSFWDEQIKAFSPRHRVVALDLPGHGESGADRKKWGMPEFGDDVRAVVEAEGLKKVVIFGNSLGGPVAVEAALRLPGKVLGVVGIDTFQMLGGQSVEQARKQAEAFRSDYAGSIKVMVKRLFHPDAPPALMADAEQRMLHTPPEVAYQILLSLGGYDEPAAVGRLTVPLLAINGDLYGTDLTNVRNVKPDFEAIVMKHMGHYPMLERPQEFDGHASEVVAALARHAADGKPMQLAGALASPKARKEVRLTPAQLDRCTGRYEIAPGFVLAITREGDRLLSQATGQPSVEIFAESEKEFFPKAFDARLSFEIEGDGPAKGVVLHQGGRDVPARRLE